jgi:hypothetical protein
MHDARDVEARTTNPDAGDHDSMQDVIALYRRDIDMTLIRERLAMSVGERFAAHERALDLVLELRRAGQAMRDAAKVREPGS